MATIIYNSETTQSWYNELRSLHITLEERTYLLKTNEHILQVLDNDLQKLEQLIQSLQSIQQAKTALQSTNYQDRSLPTYTYQDKSNLTPAFSNLSEELNWLTAEQLRLQTTAAPFRDTVQANKQIIDDATTRMQWLTREIQASDQFLNALRNTPHDLTKAFGQNILTSLQHFSETHPTRCSPQTRVCLLHYHEKVNLLMARLVDADIETARQIYLGLCALVHEMYYPVLEENSSKDFIQCLQQLVAATHIAYAGDLPNDMRRGISPKQYLTAIKNETPWWLAATAQNIDCIERAIFIERMYYMKTRVVYQTALNEEITLAIELLESEASDKLIKKQPVDYHLYNHTLNALYQLSFACDNPKAAKPLIALANHVSGSPSFSKKLWGTLGLIIGTLLIATSISCLLATVSGSSLLTAYGLTLGLSFLENPVVVGASLSATALVSSSLGLWSCNQLRKGMRHGLSQQLIAIEKEAENPTFSA